MGTPLFATNRGTVEANAIILEGMCGGLISAVIAADPGGKLEIQEQPPQRRGVLK
jgi:hypothetical protein